MSARTDPENYRDRDLHELHAHERDIEPVGYQEIAARLGVDEDTVRKWRTRGIFPEPEPTTVGGRPWWRWGTVRRWAIDTDRLSEQAEGRPGSHPAQDSSEGDDHATRL